MNLVVDDAVEVKQATKTTEERRRELGMQMLQHFRPAKKTNILNRSNFAQGRQCITHSSAPMTKAYSSTLRIFSVGQIRTAHP